VHASTVFIVCLSFRDSAGGRINEEGERRNVGRTHSKGNHPAPGARAARCRSRRERAVGGRQQRFTNQSQLDPSTTTTDAACAVTPSETVGPYPSLTDLFRSDIREGKNGLPVNLTITIVNSNNYGGDCTVAPSFLGSRASDLGQSLVPRTSGSSSCSEARGPRNPRGPRHEVPPEARGPRPEALKGSLRDLRRGRLCRRRRRLRVRIDRRNLLALERRVDPPQLGLERRLHFL
jgi:hypothetical protein